MRCGTNSATVSRRDFLQATLATTAAATFANASAGQPPGGSTGIIDVNVSLGRWPLRRMRGDDPAALVAQLRREGVCQAWTSGLDALLHKDLAAVNARLADECHRHGRGRLVPFGSVNPASPDWEEDLRRCAEVHRMPGLRLYPNYHGYKLDHPEFARLLQFAARQRVIVQLALVMEDERMMHPLLRVEPVDVTPLVALVRQTPGLRLVLLNALRTLHGSALSELVGAGDVSVEIALLEGVGGLASLLGQVPSQRVLFGSHTPLFYFESARLKLQESELEPAARSAIIRDNARRLLDR